MSDHDWKAQATAEAHISESYRRERDDARAEIARLTERCDAYKEAIKRFERADTEYRRANSAGEQPRLNKAGTAYAIAKSTLFRALAQDKTT